VATATYNRPAIYPRQREFIDAPERYAVIEAATKAGKTVGCIVWIVEKALAGKQGQDFWWVAPVYPQAEIAFKRLKRYLPRSVYKANESKLAVELANGATITFKSGEKPDNLYGEDVYAAVIDEATRVREEAWHALRSTLTATQGPVRIIGNVKGRRNWAYKMARQAEQGMPGMRHYKITAYDAADGLAEMKAAGLIPETANVVTLDEIEDARRQLPEHVFRELYLAEPSDDEGNPFGLQAIRDCIEPISTADPVAWGWDLAKHHDWTVGVALDAQCRVCRFERWQATWRATVADIRHITRGVPALVDSTGVGDPVLEQLQANGGGNFAGFHFNQTSKQQLMEGLALAIHQREIAFPEGQLTNELMAFEYVVRTLNGRVTGVQYAAPEGMYDDAVCGLALAREQWLSQGRGALLVATVEGADEDPTGFWASFDDE